MRKKASFFLALVLSLFMISQLAAQNSKVMFSIKNMGFKVKGSFSDVSIQSNFNKNDLANSYINGIVQVKSISTKNKKRDKHLLEDDYFDEPKFKQIKLKSTKIEQSTSDGYLLEANLTIKDVTKKISIPIKVTENSSSVTINADFNLNRIDYGVGGKSWVMSDIVKIQVKHTSTK